MSSVCLRRREAERGHLPSVCMCCGAPATANVAKQFAWHPSWVWLFLFMGLLPLIIVAVIVTKRMRVPIPFCDEHQNHWSWRNRVHFSFLGVLGLLLVGLVASAADPGPNELGVALLAGFLLLILAWIITAAIIQSSGIQVTEITDRSIRLTKVAPEFVEALAEQRETLGGERERWNEEPEAGDSSRGGTSCVLLVFVGALLLIVVIAAISALGDRPRVNNRINGPALPPPPAAKPEVIIDRVNRFQLDLPATGWTVTTAEHRPHNPMIFASARHTSGVVGMILIEYNEDFSVVGAEEELARRLIDNASFTQKQTESSNPLQFQGEPAVRVQFTGRREDGVQARAENTVFTRDGIVYQILVQGPQASTREDGSSFREFVDSFSLLPKAQEPDKKPRPKVD